MKTILIVGGAGYIGSHVVKILGPMGYRLVIFDNFSTGHRDSVLFGEIVVGDLLNPIDLEKVFSLYTFDAVINFAGSIIVSESVENPLKYYQNNTFGSLNLIQACLKFEVNSYIFSSTAAVYGMGNGVPLKEDGPTIPINPYGKSKLMTEWILKDASFAFPKFNHISLRYFNVAGADPKGEIGQKSKISTHLIKLACHAAIGKTPELQLYGTDYPTPDGTCIRDFIHVSDLAQAHVDALHFLMKEKRSESLNCGLGRGYSVREVIKSVKKVSGIDFIVRETERRPGDGELLVADNQKIKSTIGWKPIYTDLDFMVETALSWEKKLNGLMICPDLPNN
jgi:UDP-glucose 4-epimerase